MEDPIGARFDLLHELRADLKSRADELAAVIAASDLPRAHGLHGQMEVLTEQIFRILEEIKGMPR